MDEISGYVLDHPQEKTLYLVGDSIYDPIIQEQIEEHNPGVLVINACDARVSRGRLIMNGDDVLKLAKANPEKKIVVSHMDGVSYAYLSSEQLRSSLKEDRLEQVLIPDDGQTVMLSGFIL